MAGSGSPTSARVGAGSFATKILADAGADVIKIESRSSLDGLRLAAPFAGGVRGVNRSGYFADRNSSKRSITINLKTAEGRELARRLVAVSDVVTNNFTPGVMERFGLGYEAVREVNPQVIYLAMSMQGDDGPARNYLGYGITIGALTGFQHLTGAPGRVPIGTNTNYPDHIPNPAHAAFAVLAALRHRRRTGEGQYIDLAQTESTIAVLGPAMIEAALTDGADRPTRPGDAGGPMANAHRWRAPHGVYQCTGEDRWVAVSVHEDRQWAALREVLRLDPAALEPGWDTMAGRHRDRDRVDALIAAAARGWDARKMTAALLDAGVPCAPVQDAAEVVADPAASLARALGPAAARRDGREPLQHAALSAERDAGHDPLRGAATRRAHRGDLPETCSAWRTRRSRDYRPTACSADGRK